MGLIGSIRDRRCSSVAPFLGVANPPPSQLTTRVTLGLLLGAVGITLTNQRSLRYEPLAYPRYALIDLVHDFISCMSLPLYLWNLFADRDHPGIGVLIDAGPLSSISRLSLSKPVDPHTHTLSRVGIGGIFHALGQYRWG